MWIVKRAVTGPTIDPTASKIANTPVALQKAPDKPVWLLSKTRYINIPATNNMNRKVHKVIISAALPLDITGNNKDICAVVKAIMVKIAAVSHTKLLGEKVQISTSIDASAAIDSKIQVKENILSLLFIESKFLKPAKLVVLKTPTDKVERNILPSVASKELVVNKNIPIKAHRDILTRVHIMNSRLSLCLLGKPKNLLF